MNILLLGEGSGAEVLAQLLLKDPKLTKLYHYEPNIEIQSTERYIPVRGKTKEDLLAYIELTPIDFIVSTALKFQLWKDLQDLIKRKNIPALLPSREGGMLEWSKIHSKKFLRSAGVPTPNSTVYTRDQLITQFPSLPRPFVLKYDQDWRVGLQTIIVTDDNFQEEYATILSDSQRRFLKVMGEIKDQKFIVEEYIANGKEVSYHILCNSSGWTFIGASRDYKKRYENDQGHNTADMGSYAPAPDIHPKIYEYAGKIYNELKKQNIDYTGVLYIGTLVDSNDNPWILELNTRFGDSELQSILPLIKNSILELLHSTALNHNLPTVEFQSGVAVTIRIVNSNYSLFSITSSNLPYLPIVPGIIIGKNIHPQILYATLTTIGNTRQEAANVLYDYLKNIDMKDYTYRTDIGYLQ